MDTIPIVLPAEIAENAECFHCGTVEGCSIVPYRYELNGRNRALMFACELCRAAVRAGELSVTLTVLVPEPEE